MAIAPARDLNGTFGYLDQKEVRAFVSLDGPPDHLTIGLGSPIQIRIQKTLNLSIKRLVDIAHRETGPGIFDSLIGMHKVISDLGTETNPSFVFIIGGAIGFSFFFLDPRDRSAKHLPRLGSVLVLAALALALNHHARGNVC